MIALDCLVVGGGIAGLSVASQLLTAVPDMSVRVLEARDRVGGRIESVDSLDCGATWFWPGEERIAALVQKFDIPTHPQHLAGDAVVVDHSGRVRRVNGNPLDSPASRFSLGAASLVQALAKSLPDDVIQLSTVVTRVAVAADGGVRVTTLDGTVWQARHVVLALPPALAVSRIEFEPPLPAKVLRVARQTPVWMGKILKVVVRFSTAFWRQAGLAGSGVSQVGPIQELHDMSGPDGIPGALLGFAAAPVTEADVVKQLTAMFGAKAATYDSIILRDWAAEEFTSPANVGELTDFSLFGHQVFKTPVDGRLYWTSTETSQMHGHMEGALEAAERCSKQILARTLTKKNVCSSPPGGPGDVCQESAIE
jgi:monoamine oxidase